MFDLLFTGFCAWNRAVTAVVKNAARSQESLESHYIKCELFDQKLFFFFFSLRTHLLCRGSALKKTKKTEESGTVDTQKPL